MHQCPSGQLGRHLSPSHRAPMRNITGSVVGARSLVCLATLTPPCWVVCSMPFAVRRPPTSAGLSSACLHWGSLPALLESSLHTIESVLCLFEQLVGPIVVKDAPQTGQRSAES